MHRFEGLLERHFIEISPNPARREVAMLAAVAPSDIRMTERGVTAAPGLGDALDSSSNSLDQLFIAIAYNPV